MLQVIQYQKNGKMSVSDLPAPQVRGGAVLVRNMASLISAGTERASVTTAQASMVGKARTRPDLVKQVMDSVKREGALATYKKVQNRLDNYKELGYSSAGIVEESTVDEFKPGDRVACAGAGYASHAELIVVPRNLVVPVPDSVTFDEAAFTTVGAIALQGVRQADVRIGETVAVIGLGLVGLLTVQLLKANGCRVIGLDITSAGFALARELGCDACLVSRSAEARTVESLTRGFGADAVIITAATLSNDPVELALLLARKKGKVVIVGRVGMNFPYLPFYEKELDVRQSCSYGPGRYDPLYEEKGNDYPFAYVRWTEQRNMSAILDLVSQGRLNVKSLITHRFPIRDALQAYDLITGKVKQKYLGILIQYPEAAVESARRPRRLELPASEPSVPANRTLTVGFIGAGNFAQSYLLPPMKAAGVTLKGVATSRPVNAKSVGEKFGFAYCATDVSEILRDKETNVVVVATRHDSHARYVIDALKSGKHVFVEKPLAISAKQLLEIRKTHASLGASPSQYLMVGFNRRFSRPFVDMQEFFRGRTEPLVMTYRVNAGTLAPTSWYLDDAQGSRVVGEGCHFIDCMTFLAGGPPVSVFAESIGSHNSQVKNRDNISITLRFADGSVGTLLYLANGDTSVGKEYCEAHAGGRSAIMDNFRQLFLHRDGSVTRKKYDGLKGHKEEVVHFLNVVSGKESPSLSFDSIHATTLATLKAMDSLGHGKSLAI
jgi:polar amino acid transport system substrate-binding protein